jgi:heptaprenyl diphosphate synthase
MDLNEIYKPIDDGLEIVEESLHSETSVNAPLLSQLLKYMLYSGGKRIRPALTLLAGKFFNYDIEKLKLMATGVELLHNATLVHDDIVDNAELRRGKPSIVSAWGKGSALLLGDYLFARAGVLVASTGNIRVTKLFSQTLMTISGGELEQVDIDYNIKSARENYYKWIRAKTARLFSTSVETGAILCGAPEEFVESFNKYGYYFGMAFQIVDDILDFIGKESELGKPVGSDLLEGAVTLPSILYAETHLDDVMIKEVIETHTPELVAEIVGKIKRSPVIEESFEIARGFCEDACRAIDNLPSNECHQSLVDLAHYIIDRNK